MITGDGLLAHHRLRSGAGVPLVLLHGFPLDSRMWLDVVDLLPGEPDVIALDLPGMGESPTGSDVAATLGAPDEPSIDVSGDAVAATREADPEVPDYEEWKDMGMFRAAAEYFR